MDAVNKLLDNVRETCSLPSDLALAAKVGVSRQLVSQWRKGANPLADDRIAQLARLAHDDAGKWLLLVHAQQAHGAAAKDWAALARRLGVAAAVAFVALFSSPATVIAAPKMAQIVQAEQAHGLGIMRSKRAVDSREEVANGPLSGPAWRFHARLQLGLAPSPASIC